VTRGVVSILTQPEGWVLLDQVVSLAAGIDKMRNRHIVASFSSKGECIAEVILCLLERKERFMLSLSLAAG